LRLKLRLFCGLPSKPETVTGKDWEKKISDRTGIIFFKDYWTRKNETEANRSGDHIDLWNKNTLTPSVESFMRFRLSVNYVPNPVNRIRGTGGNWYSDLSKSTQILFWEVK